MIDRSFLVVGGGSYIGSYVAEYLLDNYPRSKITVLIRRTNTAHADALIRKVKDYPEKCSLVIGDAGNDRLITKILAEHQIDVVLYTVWDIAAGRWDPVKCFRESLSSLTQFLEAVRGYGKLKKFIFISSEEVYGNQSSKSETTATKPTSLRGAAFAACETMLNSYIISYRIPALIVRLSTVVYGGTLNSSLSERQRDDDSRTGGNVQLATVGLLNIQDAVAGIFASLENGVIGEIYNIGGVYDCPSNVAQRITKLESGEISNEQMGHFPPSTMPSEKAERELFWKAKILETEGICQLLFGSGNQNDENGTNRSATPRKILVFGTDGDILDCFDTLSRDNEDENLIISKQQLFDSNCADNLVNEIISVAPSHIIYVNIPAASQDTVIDTRTILKSNAYAALYTPWFLASFCKKCSVHFTYLTSYNSFDGEYFTNSMVNGDEAAPFEHQMAISLFTDRLLKRFDILHCRLGFVISNEKKSGKLKFNMPYIPDDTATVHISFLPDCLPIIFDLIRKGHEGVIDVANPIAITGKEIQKMCGNANISITSPTELQLKGRKINLAMNMDTSLIEKLYSNVRTGIDIIRELLAKNAVQQATNELD